MEQESRYGITWKFNDDERGTDVDFFVGRTLIEGVSCESRQAAEEAAERWSARRRAVGRRLLELVGDPASAEGCVVEVSDVDSREVLHTTTAAFIEGMSWKAAGVWCEANPEAAPGDLLPELHEVKPANEPASKPGPVACPACGRVTKLPQGMLAHHKAKKGSPLLLPLNAKGYCDGGGWSVADVAKRIEAVRDKAPEKLPGEDEITAEAEASSGLTVGGAWETGASTTGRPRIDRLVAPLDRARRLHRYRALCPEHFALASDETRAEVRIASKAFKKSGASLSARRLHRANDATVVEAPVSQAPPTVKPLEVEAPAIPDNLPEIAAIFAEIDDRRQALREATVTLNDAKEEHKAARGALDDANSRLFQAWKNGGRQVSLPLGEAKGPAPAKAGDITDQAWAFNGREWTIKLKKLGEDQYLALIPDLKGDTEGLGQTVEAAVEESKGKASIVLADVDPGEKPAKKKRAKKASAGPKKASKKRSSNKRAPRGKATVTEGRANG